MPTDASSALLASGWVARDLLGAPLVEGSRILLRFGANARLSADAGCNRLSAAYRLDGERLRIVPPMTSTRMACAPALAEQEARFLAFLGAVSRHAIEPDGALALTTARGETQRFEPEPRASR